MMQWIYDQDFIDWPALSELYRIAPLGDKKPDHKIILYANPGTESFYRKLGFRHMPTAMGIFENEADAIKRGVLAGD